MKTGQWMSAGLVVVLSKLQLGAGLKEPHVYSKISQW